MSSLERAAAVSNGARRKGRGESAPKKRATGGGIFEHSFGGMDLSEFGLSAGGGTAGRPSAAAALMRLKAEEAQRREREVKEESDMCANAASLARERSRQLKEEEERLMEGGTVLRSDEGRPSEGTEFLKAGFYSALVSMHGDGAEKERSTGSVNTLKKVKRRNHTATKLGVAMGSGAKCRKKGMAKKSKRTKY
mmetsp:Transcript_10345/g.30475  ORF Transcript_10345/g.30475 Transcript_10345/m.30475 type:complete len:194 (-) Transcript_10345:61-642(-)|eukprot:CAMPEP_0113577920 /NCGR_PEP_ID=MMETSP0015_2-20120614/29161_1 /TAXON_ID=2838 /ORGANISM="Odontella" /LENGTH=193 /DNA_ID=CAMNT_0000481603 /DNA_START=125 /DNA_END=706 /DNA_ORIENTATION=- /assembly_acc=CAM_ASM_000160